MPRLDISMSGRCVRCWLQPRYCLCDALPRVESKTRVVIVRHFKEAWSSTNSARLAHLALPNSELHDFGAMELPPITAEMLPAPEDAWLLFPADDAHPAPAPDAPPPRALVVIDGSWRQARRMARRVPGIDALPRFSPVPRYPGPDRIRRPPFVGGMATLEAIGRALSTLEGDDIGVPLEALFAHFVDRVRQQRGY